MIYIKCNIMKVLYFFNAIFSICSNNGIYFTKVYENPFTSPSSARGVRTYSIHHSP